MIHLQGEYKRTFNYRTKAKVDVPHDIKLRISKWVKTKGIPFTSQGTCFQQGKRIGKMLLSWAFQQDKTYKIYPPQACLSSMCKGW